MSWDKNTIVLSNLDNVATTLEEIGIPYKITELGKLKGFGLNDDLYGDKDKYYPIRKLEYTTVKGLNVVIAERMIRTHDCDSDDTLISVKLPQSTFDDNEWKLEIYADEDDFVDISEE